MAEEKKRPAKSESLTIRLDPKMRFIVEFIARVRGQTITTVIERSLATAADQVRLEDERGDYHDWRHFWDVSEGVRALRLAAEPCVFPTFEEERRLSFAQAHWPFFFTSNTCEAFRNYYIEVLWPRIDDFVQQWGEQKHRDYFGTGKVMQQVLKEAGLKPPEWPVAENVSSFGKGSSSRSKYADLDKDIPF